MKIITLLGAFLALIISSNYLKTFKIFKIEYPILILREGVELLEVETNKGVKIDD